MVVIAIAVGAFGVWGLYDALVAYPARGALAAKWMEYQFLDQHYKSRGLLDASVSIADPAAERARLASMKAEKGQLGATDQALLDWLDALALIGRVNAEHATRIPRTDFTGDDVPDARSRLQSLQLLFTTTTGEKVNAPSPLTAFDIPMQWLIAAAGLGIGGYIAFLVLRVRSKTYRFEEAHNRLILPDGRSFTPADIADFDKRKWHKFYVTVNIKPGHDTLGGKGVELDLLRYVPVEEWVLRMEKAAFPSPSEAATVVDAKPGDSPQSAIETQV